MSIFSNIGQQLIEFANIIQPTFKHGVDSTKWNFRNIAFAYVSNKRYRLIKELITQSNFKIIEDNLGELLHQSNTFLTNVKFEDLELDRPYSDYLK